MDAITLGNHAHRQREVYPFLNSEPRIIRPANMPSASPGRGETVVRAADGTGVAVINLIGRLYLEPAVSPFETATGAGARRRGRPTVVLVDFHAEATSEKVAMGRLLDGSATAVIGTHTHIQTNDPTVLPGGTAYLTDAGMTGPHDSVIGVRADVILARFTTGLPSRFEPAEDDVRHRGRRDRVRQRRPCDVDRDVQASRIGVVSSGRALWPAGQQQPEQHQRQPPADVRVEPVAGDHLRREHRGAGQRRHRRGVLAAPWQHRQQQAAPARRRPARPAAAQAMSGQPGWYAAIVQIESGVTRSSW